MPKEGTVQRIRAAGKGPVQRDALDKVLSEYRRADAARVVAQRGAGALGNRPPQALPPPEAAAGGSPIP
jgi:hypothetical protein